MCSEVQLLSCLSLKECISRQVYFLNFSYINVYIKCNSVFALKFNNDPGIVRPVTPGVQIRKPVTAKTCVDMRAKIR